MKLHSQSNKLKTNQFLEFTFNTPYKIEKDGELDCLWEGCELVFESKICAIDLDFPIKGDG
jgi:hypothetical protein